MGTTINNTSGTVAVVRGDHNTVTSTVNAGPPGAMTQKQHQEKIKEAQNALNDDQDALERIDGRLYEALGQFLSMARKIQVENQNIAEVQAKMKETLDEMWAQQAAKGLRPQALPEGLKVLETLAKSPITAEVAKLLIAAV
jgi:peptidoglycan hydrolase CwlO-like protein